MGKGGGCVPSKKRQPAVAGDEPPSAAPEETASRTADIATPTATELSTPPPPELKLKIFIVFYSMYGHVEWLARRMKKGVDVIEGVEGFLYRVPETLPEEVLEQMRVPEKDADVPVITAAELEEADGVLFGFPTRYGAMAAQMKAFFDSTGQLWREQTLAGKPAGFFVSTGTQGGGQETTARINFPGSDYRRCATVVLSVLTSKLVLDFEGGNGYPVNRAYSCAHSRAVNSWTAITQLAHHGMLFVPIGYTFGAGMFKMDDIRGGSPYGAGVFAGDGTREPSEMELSLAEHQGKYMASVVKRLHH